MRSLWKNESLKFEKANFTIEVQLEVEMSQLEVEMSAMGNLSPLQ